MMIAVVLLASLNASAQSPPSNPSNAWYRSHLPITLKVTQDVQVIPYSLCPTTWNVNVGPKSDSSAG